MSSHLDPAFLLRAQELREAGIAALRAGDVSRARTLLTRCLTLASHDSRAWLWLSGAVNTDAERRFCLERVLALDPTNKAALDGLTRLAFVPAEAPVHIPDPAEGATALTHQLAALSEEPHAAVTHANSVPESDSVPQEVDEAICVDVPVEPGAPAKPQRWWMGRLPLATAIAMLALLVGVGTVVTSRLLQARVVPASTPRPAAVAHVDQPTRFPTPHSAATARPAAAEQHAATPTLAPRQPTSTPSPVPPTPTFAPSASPSPLPSTDGLSAAQLTARGLEREREREDTTGAMDDYTAAIERNPQYADAYFFRSDLWSKLGDAARANADFEQAKKLDANRAKIAFHQGRIAAAYGDFQKALDKYNEAIRLDPRFDQAYYTRAVRKTANGDSAGAIADYGKAIDINPRFAEAYNNRGILYFAQGSFDLALADHTQAIQIDPSLATRFFVRAADYVAMQDYDRAADDYDEAIRLNPNDPKLLCSRAELSITQGEYQAAVNDTTRALELVPSWYCANFNRGRAYYALGEYQRALEDFTRYVQAQPGQPQAYVSRAAAEYALKDTQAAIQDYTIAAQIYQSQGRTDQYDYLIQVIKTLSKGIHNA